MYYRKHNSKAMFLYLVSEMEYVKSWQELDAICEVS
jgi:hypothetical protein